MTRYFKENKYLLRIWSSFEAKYLSRVRHFRDIMWILSNFYRFSIGKQCTLFSRNDGCWGRNILVTGFKCWWQIQHPWNFTNMGVILPTSLKQSYVSGRNQSWNKYFHQKDSRWNEQVARQEKVYAAHGKSWTIYFLYCSTFRQT